MEKNKAKKPTWNPTLGKQKLSALLEKLAIEKADYVLVGDGSGSQRHLPSGWYCTLIDIANRERLQFFGSINRCSINFAELMAYFAPLAEILSRVLEERKNNGGKIEFRHVHIVTDSEYVQRASERKSARTANMMIWDAIEMMKRQGLLVHWHWLKRETSELNSLADVCSKMARASNIRLGKVFEEELYQPRNYNQDG